MPAHPGRQRGRDRLTLRRQPALAPIAYDVPAEHQVLHHEILVAFEREPGGTAALITRSSWITRRLVFLPPRDSACPAWPAASPSPCRSLDGGATRHALQARNLIALSTTVRSNSLTAPTAPSPALSARQRTASPGRGHCHAHIDSDPTASQEPKSSLPPGLSPLLRDAILNY